MMEQSDLKDLQSLLRQKFHDELIVKSYQVENFLPPGENYGSKIVSVDAIIIRNNENDKGNNSEEHIYMIAKLPPTSKIQREMFDSPFTFKKEIFMYDEIFPAYKKLEIENGVNEKQTFNSYADYYGSRLSLDESVEFDDDAAILLENLKTKNYYMIDRRYACDLPHAKLAIKSIAKFHALGIAMKHKKPEFFQILKNRSKCLEFKNPEDWADTFKTIFEHILDDPSLKDYHESCSKAVKLGDFSSYSAVPDEPWSTIIHSDFWTNNFMFHKNDTTNEPDDIKFVDFQNFLFLSPTRELAFFLGSGLNHDVINNHLDYLINLYYKTLIDTLRVFNIDIGIYSRETFDERLRKDARVEFGHSLCMLKIITMDINADDPNGSNVKNILERSETSEIFRTRMRDLILMLHKKNWLDE
ncbi:hypothetical protein PV326_004792 [Microctonus aethiopoides]|nr:hypothetical protein PV326_004792 [Microctonus aethiopoides]